MHQTQTRQTCSNCSYFKNSPELLESMYKGLTSLSSAYGSVRCQDGICTFHDLYIAANRRCDQFELMDSNAVHL